MAHEHRWQTFSYSTDPTRPYVLRSCAQRDCTVVDKVCLLCERDGNARKHKKRHDPVTDPVLHDDAVFMLAGEIIKHAAVYGQPRRI